MVAVPPGQESADLAGLLYAIRPRRRQPGAAVPDARRASPLNSTRRPRLEGIGSGNCRWPPMSWASSRSRWRVTASADSAAISRTGSSRRSTRQRGSGRRHDASARVRRARLRPVPRSSMPVLYSVLACPRATPTVRTRTAALPGGYCVGLAPWSAADLPRWWRSSLRQYYPAPRPRARGRSPRRAAKDGAAPGWPGSQGRTGMRRWTRYGEAPAGGG